MARRPDNRDYVRGFGENIIRCYQATVLIDRFVTDSGSGNVRHANVAFLPQIALIVNQSVSPFTELILVTACAVRHQ